MLEDQTIQSVDNGGEPGLGELTGEPGGGDGAAAGQTQGQTLEQLQAEIERLKAIEQNNQRLERKLTQVTQEYAQHKEWIDYINQIRQHPELAKRISEVNEDYFSEHGLAGRNPFDPSQQIQQDLQAIRQETSFELARERLARKYPEFEQNEEKILAYAAQEGIPVVDAKTLNLAYNAWRGANLDAFKAEAELKALQKLQEKFQGRAIGGLQGAARPGSRAKDFKKMDDDEALRAMGYKSLFTED